MLPDTFVILDVCRSFSNCAIVPFKTMFSFCSICSVAAFLIEFYHVYCLTDFCIIEFTMLGLLPIPRKSIKNLNLYFPQPSIHYFLYHVEAHDFQKLVLILQLLVGS